MLYSLVFVLSFTIVAGFLYWSTIGALQRQTDTTIQTEVAGLAERYRGAGLRGLSATIRERIAADPDGGALYLFADRSYSPLAGNLSRWPELASREDGWYSFVHERADGGIAARARVFALPEGLVLLVGREIAELDRTAALFRTAMLWGAGIATLLALCGGALMSASVLRRVEQINATTRRIMSGDLSQRIASRNTADEFDQLAANLNLMLDEIERLLGGIRHVADNVAHDLRTPLTRLRNALEEAVSGTRGTQAHAQLTAALADADSLLQTFAALLRISRLEAGAYGGTVQALALAELIEDAVDLYAAVAEEKGVVLTAECSVRGETKGDRDLLFQLLVNLVDNAVKYTPEDGRVALRLDADEHRWLVSIGDTGPGIPAALRERVLERFFRLDSSRNMPGNGLGLALVAAVARHHDAELELLDNGPGLRVELRLPRRADKAAAPTPTAAA